MEFGSGPVFKLNEFGSVGPQKTGLVTSLILRRPFENEYHVVEKRNILVK